MMSIFKVNVSIHSLHKKLNQKFLMVFQGEKRAHRWYIFNFFLLIRFKCHQKELILRFFILINTQQHLRLMQKDIAILFLKPLQSLVIILPLLGQFLIWRLNRIHTDLSPLWWQLYGNRLSGSNFDDLRFVMNVGGNLSGGSLNGNNQRSRQNLLSFLLLFTLNLVKEGVAVTISIFATLFTFCDRLLVVVLGLALRKFLFFFKVSFSSFCKTFLRLLF